MNPFFSVVIPVFNCEKTITETLKSVLNQTFTDYEIIIINDCSTDETLNIINNFKTNFNYITIISNMRNIGVAESRNIGVKIAKGIYIAFLDGDDIWEPEKLKKQKDVIDKTNCDLCCTSYSFIDENTHCIKNTYNVPYYISYKMLLKENIIGCSSVVIKKHLLLKFPMHSIYQHEDYALWLSIARNGYTIIGINEPLMKYRIHSNSRSYKKINAAKGRLIVYLKQEKLNIYKTIYYFCCYAINALRKFYRK